MTINGWINTRRRNPMQFIAGKIIQKKNMEAIQESSINFRSKSNSHAFMLRKCYWWASVVMETRWYNNVVCARRQCDTHSHRTFMVTISVQRCSGWGVMVHSGKWQLSREMTPYFSSCSQWWVNMAVGFQGMKTWFHSGCKLSGCTTDCKIPVKTGCISTSGL